jgi:acid phosphatase family membrane protein YuiD
MPPPVHYLTKAPSLGDGYTMSFDVSTWAGSVRSFFANPIILSSLTGWFVSQLIKGVIALLHIRKKGFREVLETLLWRTGGMPSSHAAVVTGMTAAVGFHEGLGSNLFAVSLMVAMVVMRDAMGVRRASGLQAKALNLLGRRSSEKLDIEFQPVKEIQGHAPLEVIVGGLLGVIIAALYACR